MPLDDLKHESVWLALGVFISGCAEYMYNHPLTAVSSILMLLVAWERYRKSRLKTREMRAKAKKAEQEEAMIKLKAEDWQRRFEEHQREEEEIKRNARTEDKED